MRMWRTDTLVCPRFSLNGVGGQTGVSVLHSATMPRIDLSRGGPPMRSRLNAALMFLAVAVPMLAATVAGVTMEDKTTVNGQTLVLNGAGLRKKFFIKVYIGGLYLSAKQSNAAAI